MKNVSEKLRRERISARISQTELALTLRRSQMWISCLERGRVKITTDLEGRIMSAIRRLADVKSEAEQRRKAISEDVALPVHMTSSEI